ncbi:hypothetical protein Tco_1132268 [Tanacetum coccineum]|uniref:Uncharacterized protein n=1 Tax=Tanacetum coccineum TaxID=301880 RepID=A0ABQ5JE72_9ASTR
MDSNFNNENDPWEYSLDIDDLDLHLTPVLRPSSSTRVEPSPSTPNPVRILPGPAGIKVVEDVGEDDDFKSGSWVSATNYVNANGGTVTGCLGDIKNFLKNEKLKQVVAIVKSCSPNVVGDLTVTIKDLSDVLSAAKAYGKAAKRGGLLGLKRLHGFLEVTTAQVHNGNYAKWFGINKWYQSFASRNFDLEDMEFESTNSGTTGKLPILKLGEYEMWVIRIKQYFQIQDYAL